MYLLRDISVRMSFQDLPSWHTREGRRSCALGEGGSIIGVWSWDQGSSCTGPVAGLAALPEAALQAGCSRGQDCASCSTWSPVGCSSYVSMLTGRQSLTGAWRREQEPASRQAHESSLAALQLPAPRRESAQWESRARVSRCFCHPPRCGFDWSKDYTTIRP
jgi:hypothetical protein